MNHKCWICDDIAGWVMWEEGRSFRSTCKFVCEFHIGDTRRTMSWVRSVWVRPIGTVVIENEKDDTVLKRLFRRMNHGM